VWLDIDIEPILRAETDWFRKVDRFSDRTRLGVERAVQAGATEAIQTHRYQDQTGLLTSRIRGYIEFSGPDGATGVIAALTDYASYVDQDTKPHPIHGNPFLVFKARDGNWVRTRVVQHPGTTGDQFMARGLLRAESVLLHEVHSGIAELQRVLGS